MDIFLRDMRSLGTGAKILKILYLLKTALTVAIIVFSVSEVAGALRKSAAVRQMISGSSAE